MPNALTLAPDLAERIQLEADRTGEPFEQVADRLLRSSLNGAGSPRKPFKVRSFPLGVPAEWTSGKVEDLLDILEGPDRKW